MTKAIFSTFPNELKASFRVFRATWRTSAKIVFLPLIPLVFTFPYLVILYSSLQYNEFPALSGSSVLTGIVALVAVITFLMLLEIVRASLFAVYSQGQNIGARRALQIGTRRFPSFLYTDVISLVYLTFSMLPFAILIFWANNGGSALLGSVFSPIIANIILLIALVIFLAPLVVVATWLTFTQIIVATGKHTGFHALTYSTTLVRPVILTILKKLVAWMIFAGVISYAVSPLPIFYWLIPLIIKLWGVAFVVVLYKEATGHSLVGTQVPPKRATRTRKA